MRITLNFDSEFSVVLLAMTYQDILTAEELTELSAFNCVAFDLHRTETDQIPPCWLCMSDDARKNIRERLVAYLNDRAPNLTGWTVEMAEKFARRHVSIHDLDQWRHAEAAYKQLRAEQHPRAYFAEYWKSKSS